MNGPVCRICLSAGSAEHQLVQPCACAGTMGYTHAACLTAWVQEKGDLTCEVCQQQYKEPLLHVLQQQQQTAPAGEGSEGRQTGIDTCCGRHSDWLLKYGILQLIGLL